MWIIDKNLFLWNKNVWRRNNIRDMRSIRFYKMKLLYLFPWDKNSFVPFTLILASLSRILLNVSAYLSLNTILKQDYKKQYFTTEKANK